MALWCTSSHIQFKIVCTVHVSMILCNRTHGAHLLATHALQIPSSVIPNGPYSDLTTNYLSFLSLIPDIPPHQIGRSADSAIDMVVLETVTGADGKKTHKSNSTISRYACRIQCERSPPYSARIYAAAFDTQGKIKLSVGGHGERDRGGCMREAQEEGG